MVSVPLTSIGRLGHSALSNYDPERRRMYRSTVLRGACISFKGVLERLGGVLQMQEIPTQLWSERALNLFAKDT